MRIWHQSFTDLTEFPQYRQTLEQHAVQIARGDFEVSVHGLRPGTYPSGITPMEFNTHASLRYFNAQQVCEAALAAQALGYDAFALGCFFDPALHEVRALVDIPVVSLSESCMLIACSLGRKFGIIAVTEFQKMLVEDLATQYGVSSRLAATVAMSPSISLRDLEGRDELIESIKERFLMASREALSQGAEVIIPGDGVLNEFLVRNNILHVDDAVVMDSLGALFQHAAFFVRGVRGNVFNVSRRLIYKKPTDVLLAHAHRSTSLKVRSENEFS